MSLSPSTSPGDTTQHEQASLRQIWFLLLAFGLISVLAGCVAISHAVVATVASVMVFGVILLIAGITELIHAVMVRQWKGFALHLLSAGLYSIVGLFMLEDPVRAAAVITLLLTASFIVGGVLRIVFSLAVRFPSWPWVLLNGVVDLVLGMMIWSEWPDSKLWVIGLFLGIELIFQGWSWIFLALAVKNSPTNPAPVA